MDSETDGQAPRPEVTGAASARMRTAREAAGLSLADVAQRTRVPLRHLEALERGDYAALPGITYCAGFARAFARAVDLDENALVAQVREEIEHKGDFAGDQYYQIDEPADPARVPPRALAWTVAIVGLLLAGGYALWRMQINTPPAEDLITQPSPQHAPAAKPVAPPRLLGPVVLTAAEDVWLRIYDADGKALLEKTMPKGESFTVPEGVNNPMILTGRPDALAVTVGGRPVPPLGTAERTISDVPISAEALLARGTSPPAGTATPAAATPSPQGPPAAQPAASQARPAAPAATPVRPATQSVPRVTTPRPKPATPAAQAPATPAAQPAADPAPGNAAAN